MQITVKKLDGTKEEIMVESSDITEQLKETLSDKTGGLFPFSLHFCLKDFAVHKDQVRLIFKGKPMVDDKTLAEQGVTAGATIHMVLQLRGGSQ